VAARTGWATVVADRNLLDQEHFVMARLFGTDGVRGVAGLDLDARLATDLAAAAAGVLAGTGAFDTAQAAKRRPLAVLGRDPRASGEFLEAAVVAGLAASGVDVLRLGVVPTPAVAYLTAELSAELGVVLSASHNLAPDNGIKFFGPGGYKLPDGVELEIETRLASAPDGTPRLPGGGFGRVRDGTGETESYLRHLLAAVGTALADGAPDTAAGHGPLAGLRIVVDCANGAAFELAPRVLRLAGAQVHAIGVQPDGSNINAGCGSTSLDALRFAVAEREADAGIAHDGDADRCLAVDASGEVVDGDQILAILAITMKEAGRLPADTVVATVMSNLGFRLAMRDAGIRVVQTPVGDRSLLAAMLAGGYALGGEQSGHIVLLDHATTGDGLLTALQLLAIAARRGQPLSKLAQVMSRYPQVLVTVPVQDKAAAASSSGLTAAVGAAEAELGESGRVLVRPSGTEPAVRVMVEAVDSALAHRVADRLAGTIRQLG
jgi:phosphoglucosamine mutase